MIVSCHVSFLISADSLSVESLLELLDEESLRKDTALPSPEWSSDHIALLAEFRCKPRIRRWCLRYVSTRRTSQLSNCISVALLFLAQTAWSLQDWAAAFFFLVLPLVVKLPFVQSLYIFVIISETNVTILFHCTVIYLKVDTRHHSCCTFLMADWFFWILLRA